MASEEMREIQVRVVRHLIVSIPVDLFTREEAQTWMFEQGDRFVGWDNHPGHMDGHTEIWVDPRGEMGPTLEQRKQLNKLAGG